MRCLQFAVLLILPHLAVAQGMRGSLPAVGDCFRIHEETVLNGTVSWDDGLALAVGQHLELSGQALTVESDAVEGAVFRYSFDRFFLSIDIEDQGASTLEILPGKAILDGTPVYDREENPDIPVGLLDLVINEEIHVRVGPDFEVLELSHFRKNRTERSFFDLLAFVRETVIPAPPRGIGVGEAWAVRRPLAALGGDFVLPATETFQVNIPESEENPIRTLQKTVATQLTEPKSIAIRLGPTVTPNLVFDALGPNLVAPPPPVKVRRFRFDSKGILEFNTEWGFPQRIGSISEIQMESEVPPPDGIQMRKKTLFLTRQTLIEVTKVPERDLGDVARDLWLGTD